MASGGNHACVVGPKTRVSGALSGRQDVLVQGFVEGSIELHGELVVSPEGELLAKLDVDRVLVAGQICGEIYARERLVIEAGARVEGKISAASLVIGAGALVFGEVEMFVDLPRNLDEILG